METSLLGSIGLRNSQGNGAWPIYDAVNIIYRDKLRQELAVPPYFKVHLKCTAIQKNRCGQFQCVPNGFPVPEFEWFKGPTLILRSNNVVDEKDSGKYRCNKSEDGGITLMIMDLSASDLGHYACKITNEFGEAWSIAVLETAEDCDFREFVAKDKKTRKIQVHETIEIIHGQQQRPVNLDCEVPDKNNGLDKPTLSIMSMSRGGIFVAFASSKTPVVDAFTVSKSTQSRQVKACSHLPGFMNRGSHEVAEPIAPILEETLQTSPHQDLAINQIGSSAEAEKCDLEIASTKLDEVIQKLVEFSNEDCVIVSSLAIDKDNMQGLGEGAGLRRKFADQILLSGSLESSPRDALNEDRDFYDMSRKSQKPRFVLGLEDMEIAAGSEVYLNVSVTGYPPPQLFWFKDGSPLNMDLAGMASDKLMHGQAIYSCIARNIAGEAITSATVFAVKESASTESPVDESIIATNTQTEEGSSDLSHSGVLSRSLVDYLRSKAKEMAGKRIYTREIVPAAMTGSILSLSSISTANFETAEEDLWFSDARWEENDTTVEEDYESSDYYFSSDLLTSFAREDPDMRCSSAKRLTLESSFSQERSFDDRSEVSTPVPMATTPPSFLMLPKDFTFLSGSEFQIVCSVAGDPQPTVSWYRNGVKIADGTKILDAQNIGRFQIHVKMDENVFRVRNYSFIIQDSKYFDAGEYSVTATNNLGSVTVTCCGKEGSNKAISGCSEFSQPSFITSIQDLDGVEGNNVSITFCIGGQPEPDVTVMHKNEEIYDEKYQLEKFNDGRYTLTIKNLQLDDEGEIKICAVNVIGFCESTCEVFVDDDISMSPSNRSLFAATIFDNVISESVLEEQFPQESPPRFDEITEDVVAAEGSEVSFTVSVYGWPTPTVVWKKDNEDITIDGRIKMETKDYGVHSLLITNVDTLDYGIYSCIAKNIVGEISCKAELTSLSGMNAEDSTNRLKENGGTVRFKDQYKVEEVIGSGSFSVVSLVKPRNDDSTKYAAKYISCRDPGKRMECMNEVNMLRRPALDFTARDLIAQVPMVVGRDYLIIIPSSPDEGAELRKLLNYIPINRTLSHENIVAYKDVFVTKKQIILVMEYSQVEWFDFLLQERDGKESMIAKQVRQICTGLEYLHKLNIVHLNIKPENIMIKDNGKKMKIIDFGNAKQILDEGLVFDFGDPEFIGPEIVDGKPIVITTDMWSLGITVYVALSGSSPFHGQSDFNTLQNIQEGKIEFSNSFAKVSAPAIDFMKRLLVADKSVRMQSREAVDHAWFKERFDSSENLPSGRLKYFCSRRRWQRSLIGPRTSLTCRSISSLLKKEFDSTSIIVPKQLFGNYISSSTVTESDDESPTQHSQKTYNITSVESYDEHEFSEKPEDVARHNSCKLPTVTTVLNGGATSRPVMPSVDLEASDSRLPVGKLERPRISMKMLGKKVSFEGDSPCDTRDKSVTEIPQNEDDVISERKQDGGRSNDVKKSPRKKSFAKTRRQASLNRQLEWSSSESDDTIHESDRMTLSLSEKSKTAFTHKNMDVSDRKYMRGILKNGSSISPSNIKDQDIPPNSPRYRALSPRNREYVSSRVKQLVRGTSLNIDTVPKLYVTNEDTQGQGRTSNAVKRRAEMRRGSSVESVLSKKLSSHLGGLRGPLLEKYRQDEPTAGMTLRSSQPIMTRGGSLTHSVESSNQNTPTLDVPFRDHFFGTTRSDELTRMSNDSSRPNHKRCPSTSSRSSSLMRGENVRSHSQSKWHASECYGPFFKSKLMSQGITSKQVSAVLFCLVDANPPPEVAWFKDGKEINYCDRFDVISEPSIFRYQLKIRSLKLPTDFGEYLFKARNNLGEIESTCTMSAAVVPEGMQRPAVVHHANGTVWVKWDRPHNCADHPIHYRLEYREPGNLVWVVADNCIRETTYCFHNLKSNGSYRFRVRAENNAGIGRYSRASRRLMTA